MTEREKAERFLLERLNAEQSASRNLKAMLVVFANRLLKLYKKYNVSPDSPQAAQIPMLQIEIAKLVREFKDELYDDVELLCVHANEEKKDHIILLINLTIEGMTLKGRIDKWTKEILGQINNLILNNPKAISIPPKDIEGILKIGGGYGMDRLIRQTIADSYMNEWKEQHPNAEYFISHVSSSNPCKYCMSVDGVKQPIKDYPTYGNYHPNCCCVFLFYNN